MKLKWKVSEVPTGRYRSFHGRQWPSASYVGTDKPAVYLSCEDDYIPAQVRVGTHAPIWITMLHHNHPDQPVSWKRY